MLTLQPSQSRTGERLPVEPLGRLLDDLALLIAGLDDDTFVARPRPAVSGSVGSHVRHILDHVSAFVEASARRLVNYDARHRGTEVEASTEAALAHICRLQLGLGCLSETSRDEHVQVVAQLDADGQAISSWSTLGRELAFVMNHTIHHQAIISLLLDAERAAALPRRFGYAPSTPLDS